MTRSLHVVPAHLSFDRAPLRVYWEITRACSLACRHCRAEASPHADPHELTPDEGRDLLERFAAFGDPKPHVILTGGDPLERRDLFDLIAYAQSLDLHVSVSPSATPRLTPEVIRRLKGAGVEAISLSLDGATPASHDALRGVPGCFERTLAAARAAADASLMVQVNTLVSSETLPDLALVHALAVDLGVARWSLFFLVSVGRGTVLRPIDADQAEQVLGWAADLEGPPKGPIVTTTEAPHYRRVVLERRRAATTRSGFGVRDGNGVLFISHTGDISPSGFLPLAAGNARADDVVETYRSAPLFVSLRRAADFRGRCGECGFHAICGGSRARAWAHTGDPLAEDPLCTYDPRAATA
jgi:MoaA/NifB/PqqE/SkfB family radical SAM enzyme